MRQTMAENVNFEEDVEGRTSDYIMATYPWARAYRFVYIRVARGGIELPRPQGYESDVVCASNQPELPCF